MLVKIAQILVNYNYRKLLLKAQTASDAGTLSNEGIIHVALEQFNLFAEKKWGCNLQPHFAEIFCNTK